jgi:hypothetical protein
MSPYQRLLASPGLADEVKAEPTRRYHEWTCSITRLGVRGRTKTMSGVLSAGNTPAPPPICFHRHPPSTHSVCVPCFAGGLYGACVAGPWNQDTII